MRAAASKDRAAVQSAATLVPRHRLLLAIVLVYAAAFRLLVLNRPFAYDAEGSGCLNAVLARNYLRFEWTETRGMPILSVGPPGAAPPVRYPDHPPLVPLLIVPFYAAAGVGEWQTRLPIALTTIAAIAMLYRLAASAATPRAGVLAAAIFAATPMTLYFGGFADVVGMPLVLCALVAVDAYLRFHRAPGRGTFARFAAAFAVAALCDWPAYVLVPVLVAHFSATRPRRDWRWIGGFAVGATALFVATYAYITLATGYGWDWIVPLFARRSAVIGGSSVTFAQWLGAAVRINRAHQSLPLLACAALGLAALARRRAWQAQAVVPLALLLSWAALYIAIGAKALYDHEWAWLPLTPCLALAAASILDRAIDAADAWHLPRAGRAAAALLVSAFAAWSAATTFGALYPGTSSEPYAPEALGAAIRAAAPEAGDVALLVGGDSRAQTWFYGDRPLRTGIWTVDDVERRRRDDTVDLMFDFDEQPFGGEAAGVVLPRRWGAELPALREYLTARYRPVALTPAVAASFEVFDLR